MEILTQFVDLIKFLIDFILHIDAHLAELVAQYGTWVYAILFLIVFCETGLVVTPFLPGDSLLFVAGALAALDTNDVNVHIMVLLLLCVMILGDAVNYSIGRLFGEKLFSKPNSRIFRREYLIKPMLFMKNMVVKRLFWQDLCRLSELLRHSLQEWEKCHIVILPFIM